MCEKNDKDRTAVKSDQDNGAANVPDKGKKKVAHIKQLSPDLSEITRGLLFIP